MRNPRFNALQELGARVKTKQSDSIPKSSSECFGRNVFTHAIMQRMLPKEIYKNVIDAIEKREKIKPEYADTIAVAMKEWALSRGATHYTHWFQPLTGMSAEKHDAFIDWNTEDRVLEKFSGKELLQGEPDASSFPSGGLRSTYEARGYTGWDPSSPVFLWKGGDGVTLCIPSVFFSWAGDVLDNKIPLLRSDKAINDAVLRLLKITGISANYVHSTLGSEQEYFIIDRALRNLRPDLVLCGNTVFGAPSPKGQELQDHYFGAVKDRVLAFMRDFEEAAIELAIPVKTRHNEVAPSQHEVAPVFERSPIAVDHNILLMELMRQVAVKHDLACLLHEKPFQGLNGSGKHCNWSLATETGINLLNPTDTPENNLHFLVLLTAILKAVHDHSALLRASIGSASNDKRLGGHEAPPPIISVYLGKELEEFLHNIEHKGTHKSKGSKDRYDFGLDVLPNLTKDNTDRNRTSPFAFTGNKFEFRAVGSSASPAFPVIVLNTIVAQSLNMIMDDIEAKLSESGSLSKATVLDAVIPVIQKYLKGSKGILFGGDNYSDNWKEEALKRKLPIIKETVDAIEYIKASSTIEAFKDILTKSELESRYEVVAEQYAHAINIEANVMIDMFYTQILPAASKQQQQMSKSLIDLQALIGDKAKMTNQTELLEKLNRSIETALTHAKQLAKERVKAMAIPRLFDRAKAFSSKIVPLCESLRNEVDFLETIIDDSLWILPKYREMLFLL
jgi:glutamine synthetase